MIPLAVLLKEKGVCFLPEVKHGVGGGISALRVLSLNISMPRSHQVQPWIPDYQDCPSWPWCLWPSEWATRKSWLSKSDAQNWKLASPPPAVLSSHHDNRLTTMTTECVLGNHVWGSPQELYIQRPPPPVSGTINQYESQPSEGCFENISVYLQPRAHNTSALPLSQHINIPAYQNPVCVCVRE